MAVKPQKRQAEFYVCQEKDTDKKDTDKEKDADKRRMQTKKDTVQRERYRQIKRKMQTKKIQYREKDADK